MSAIPSGDCGNTSQPLADDLVCALEHIRFTVASEADLQRGIAAVLHEHFSGRFAREHHLSASCRPDFWFPAEGLAIEVKWRPSGGSVQKIVSQLARYASCPDVKDLLVLSPSRRVLAALPAFICGIRVSSVLLGTGF